MAGVNRDLLLRQQFAAFCEMVESFAEHLLACAKNKELRYDYAERITLDKEQERLWSETLRASGRFNTAVAAGDKREQRREDKDLSAIESQANQLPLDAQPPRPGCVVYESLDRHIMGYEFIHRPLKNLFVAFWITPDVKNPLPWLLNPQRRYLEDLSRQEHLMCDCVVLAVAHDEDPAPRLLGHLPANPVYKHEPYAGEYFKRDDFCARLWEDLIEDPERLRDADSNVQEYLEKAGGPEVEASGTPPTPPSPETQGKSLPTRMDEGMRSYGRRFIAALKALHEAGEYTDGVRPSKAHQLAEKREIRAAADLADVVGSRDVLADFLNRATKSAPGNTRHIGKALGLVINARRNQEQTNWLWRVLAGVRADPTQFSYRGFIEELEAALEAFDAQPSETPAREDGRSEPTKHDTVEVVVHKSTHNYSPCDKLLESVAGAPRQKGAPCKERTYRSLRERLKKLGYEEVIQHLRFEPSNGEDRAGTLKTTLPAGALIVRILEKP